MTATLGKGEAHNLALPEVQRWLLADAVDQGPALIFVADHEMEYVAVNQTACEALGYTREELLSLTVTDVAVAPTASDDFGEMLRERTKRGLTQIRTKDGRLLDFQYRASEVRVAHMPYFVSVGFLTE
jgi:PAS domain S-box-containing protein